MIGQNKLKSILECYTSDTFPHSLLLVGENGCGKHTFINEYIIPKLDNIISRDITKSISLDMILQISINPEPTLYLIDIDNLSEKQQNVILKLVEEPYSQIYLVLISQNLVSVLPTIQNRCMVWTFEPYTKEELANFTSNLDLINWIKSPGKLLLNNDLKISEVRELCAKLLTSVKKISLSNLFTVTDRIDWNNKSSKLNCDIFCQVLIQTAAELVRDRQISTEVFKLTDKYSNSFLSSISFDKRRIFEKYLLELKYGLL